MGIFERELQKNVRIKERPCNDSSFNQSEPMQPSEGGTMAGFEDYRPKTKAQNFAPLGAILFQFQNF